MQSTGWRDKTETKESKLSEFFPVYLFSSSSKITGLESSIYSITKSEESKEKKKEENEEETLIESAKEGDKKETRILPGEFAFHPCKIPFSYRAIPYKIAQECREWICKLLMEESNPPNLRFPSLSFQSDKDLTPERMNFAFNVIDSVWYGGTLLSQAAKQGVSVSYQYYPFETSYHADQPSAKTVAYWLKKDGSLQYISFEFNQNRFGTSANCRRTNGIFVTYGLMSLVVTALHELNHLRIYLHCPEQQGHETTFTTWSHKLNGLSETHVSYAELSGCPSHHDQTTLHSQIISQLT